LFSLSAGFDVSFDHAFVFSHFRIDLRTPERVFSGVETHLAENAFFFKTDKRKFAVDRATAY
jgi:hypothetical protein